MLIKYFSFSFMKFNDSSVCKKESIASHMCTKPLYDWTQISFLDEPGGPAGRTSAGVRRVPHSRGVGGTARARRTTNVHNANHHQSQTSTGK